MSPIASGIKLVNPTRIKKFEDLSNIDFFSNDTKISDIYCYVFLIHGMKDKIIPQSHSVTLAKKSNGASEWYPKKGDHTNIISSLREKFYNKCYIFIEQLRYLKDNFNNSYVQNVGFLNLKSSLRFQDNYVKSNEKNEKSFSILVRTTLRNDYSSSDKYSFKETKERRHVDSIFKRKKSRNSTDSKSDDERSTNPNYELFGSKFATKSSDFGLRSSKGYENRISVDDADFEISEKQFDIIIDPQQKGDF